jgi:hypothetical protein
MREVDAARRVYGDPLLEFPNNTVEGFGEYEVLGSVRIQIWPLQVIEEKPWISSHE